MRGYKFLRIVACLAKFFLEYTNLPAVQKKLKHLDHKERLLLYYFMQLDQRDQDDILAFMKVKLQNRNLKN